MEQLVSQDSRQLPGAACQFLVQHNFAFPNEGSGVNRLAEFSVGIKFACSGGQGRQEADLDAASLKSGEALLNPLNEPVAAARVAWA